jgi:hypothetical protein
LSLLRHRSRRSSITKLAATSLAFLVFAPGAGAAEPFTRALDLAGPSKALSERQYQGAGDGSFVIQGQYHAERRASETRHERGSTKGFGLEQAISRAAHSAVSIPSQVLAANLRRSRRISVSNCVRILPSISVQNCSTKSPGIVADRQQSRWIQFRVERAAPSRPEGADVHRDTKLMLQIGGLLGLVYGAFLVLWLWATRVRPRMRRGARV